MATQPVRGVRANKPNDSDLELLNNPSSLSWQISVTMYTKDDEEQRARYYKAHKRWLLKRNQEPSGRPVS